MINLFKILLTLGLSSIIGWNREKSNKNAGLRTIMLLSLGTVLFTIISHQFHVINDADGVRILQAIIIGTGFLSPLVIKSDKHTEGITTLASVWASVSISMLTGLGYYFLAIIGTIISYQILKLKPIIRRKKNEIKKSKIHTKSS